MQTGQCCLLLNTYTFAGWVTGSMYRDVTGIFFWSHANRKYDLCSDETWMLNKQGSLACSPWKSVCHDWTATDGTHNCMRGCEGILAVTASWLISVCGFCLCGIRRWKSRVWWFVGMKELLNLLQRCWVEKQDQSLDRFGHVSLPYLTVFCKDMSQNTFISDYLAFFWWKDTLKLNTFWDLLSSGIVHSVEW